MKKLAILAALIIVSLSFLVFSEERPDKWELKNTSVNNQYSSEYKSYFSGFLPQEPSDNYGGSDRQFGVDNKASEAESQDARSSYGGID